MGYRAVAPDLRGFGDSDAPDSVASYTCFHLVGDLVELINVVAPDEGKVFVVGHDWGVGSYFGLKPGEIEAEFAEIANYYVTKFQKTGYTGGLNYYRNFDRNWELLAPWAGCEIKTPAKFIVGDKDLVYHMPGMKDYIHKGGFKEDVPLLQEVVVMEGVGHFINMKIPDEITNHIFNFFFCPPSSMS
ncbi:hypothetical protein V6N13_139356 [Hibiscus sabdariffa]